MSKTVIPDDIAALARKIGWQFKSEKDLADFSRLLKKIAGQILDIYGHLPAGQGLMMMKVGC